MFLSESHAQPYEESDPDIFSRDRTVRGRFIHDVWAADDLTPTERDRILRMGLRALDGHEDLEVP